ncbi:hypothetical protein [Geomonas azotofigens]|uniref:hypothetical protein n=1 Tax=Geomonas azotofigens TaxID=2843196 RepID=UPI001C116D7E|nr:hypothetical protein [Geomonas azotofigens]MBU5614471.1 hypothetical protein [Geomonas azotofigens]
MAMTTSDETLASPLFSQYRNDWQERAPNLERQQYEDEIKLVEGLPDMKVAPTAGVVHGSPPTNMGEDHLSSSSKYLWVITGDAIPYILETGDDGAKCARGRLSHTNLTGGATAHSGGEMWFESESKVYISGASSRYTPRNQQELNAVVDGFKRAGYNAISLGWDEGINKPARNLRK